MGSLMVNIDHVATLRKQDMFLLTHLMQQALQRWQELQES